MWLRLGLNAFHVLQRPYLIYHLTAASFSFLSEECGLVIKAVFQVSSKCKYPPLSKGCAGLSLTSLTFTHAAHLPPHSTYTDDILPSHDVSLRTAIFSGQGMREEEGLSKWDEVIIPLGILLSELTSFDEGQSIQKKLLNTMKIFLLISPPCSSDGRQGREEAGGGDLGGLCGLHLIKLDLY